MLALDVRTKVVQVCDAIQYLRNKVSGYRLCEVSLRRDPGGHAVWESAHPAVHAVSADQLDQYAHHSSNSPPTTSSVTMNTFLGVTYTAYSRMQCG